MRDISDIDIKKSFQHMLEIEHYIKRGVDVFSLKGFLEFNNYIYLQEKSLECLKKNNPQIVFNLKNLKFIDSSGVQLIVMLYRKLLPFNQRLKLCCSNPNVNKIFVLCHFEKMLDFFETEDEAISSFFENEEA